MLKRIFSIFAIFLIVTGLFFEGYSLKCPVYADSNTDQWTQVTNNDQLADAFRVYCKSRDLTIEGSIADGVTSFTTATFNGLCRSLGIDITALQAQVKYQTDGNIGTKYLFTALGIDAYNRIFAQFLQDNEIDVGDEVDDKSIYTGDVFVDQDGYSCLIWNMPSIENNTSTSVAPIKYGTKYKYDGFDIESSYDKSNIPNIYAFNISATYSMNVGLYYTASHYDSYLRETITDAYKLANTDNYAVNNVFNEYINNVLIYGQFIIYRVNNGSNLYFGKFTDFGNLTRFPIKQWNRISDMNYQSEQVQNVNIYITTNNNTVNNNNYEGDTIINNNGTTGDGDTPITPPDPDEPTPDPPTLPDDGGWQDWQLPNMPNDWLIYGMEKKFPFDIPFNLLFALSLLNHEPEIPKFEGDIDLKVCTWHYNIDLTPFDDIAAILRKFEVLAFIIGLAILTKNLINWG